MFYLDYNMGNVNVYVYGVAMAADVLADRWKRLLNIFRSYFVVLIIIIL